MNVCQWPDCEVAVRIKWCSTHSKAAAREGTNKWKRAHPDRVGSSSNWYRNHKERAKSSVKAWKNAHIERVRDTDRARRDRNRERINEQYRAWRAKHPEYLHNQAARRVFGVGLADLSPDVAALFIAYRELRRARRERKDLKL